MDRITMSQEHRDSLDWLKRAGDGHVRQPAAGEKMRISDRWVRGLTAESFKALSGNQPSSSTHLSTLPTTQSVLVSSA